MNDEHIYYLNGFWKWSLIIIGVLADAVFGWLYLLSIFVGGQKFDASDFLFFFAFMLLGAELIYEGARSRVILNDAAITYYQPRFTLICKWENFSGLLPNQPGLTFVFSRAEIRSGKWLATLLRLIGPWHRAVPVGAYLTREMFAYLRETIWPQIQKLELPEKERANLTRLFGNPS